MQITIENLDFTYKLNTPFAMQALENINLSIAEGEFVCLIGPTGSGKSTLIQQLNGLLLPTNGKIQVEELVIMPNSKRLNALRRRVGLVFQYPENQLFEETIFADIAFGPKNLGLNAAEIEERVKKAMALVKLDYEKLKNRSPFALSGGQMRRVAIAGVLAMETKILVLDEPIAGLDPLSRNELLSAISELHEKLGITIIMISHSMDDVAKYAQRVIVMDNKRIIMDDSPREIFKNAEKLLAVGLDVPTMSKLLWELKKQGWQVKTDCLSLAEAKAEILQAVRRKKNA
ncbi:MAG: energy-coupling factor transporter ATPase [Clostridia bacterium]